MATSGVVKSWTVPSGSTGAGAHYELCWTAEQIAKGKTRVSWTLQGKGRSASPTWLKNYCTIDVTYNETTERIYTLLWNDTNADNLTVGHKLGGVNTSFDESKNRSWRVPDDGELLPITVEHDEDGYAEFRVQLAVKIHNEDKDPHLLAEPATCVLDLNDPYYRVTYNANGGTNAPSIQAKTPEEELVLTSEKPTRTGYTFKGWATSAASTTVDYAAGAAYTADADITLYAVWELNTYRVQYNDNSYTVTSGMPSEQTKTYGTALTLSSSTPVIGDATVTGYTVTFNPNGGNCNTSSLTSNRTRHAAFSHWNTKADGTGTTYNKGASYETNSATTLYLQPVLTYSNLPITLPTAERAGYKLLGWATEQTATEGFTNSYTPDRAVTLYAIWQAQGLVYIDSGTAFEPYSIWIDNGSSWDQYIAYVDTGTEWVMCGD